MPEIIVTAGGQMNANGPILLRERITVGDLESGHFADQLVERLGWAVLDADELEHRPEAGPAKQAPAVASAARRAPARSRPR